VEDGTRWVELWAMAELATPMAVRVAATLGIADFIARGPQSASTLAKETGSHPDTLERVLLHLVSAGVLRRDDSGLYTLTPLGDTLRADHPAHMRQRLDIEGAVGRADLSFFSLLHSVRTGEPAYRAQFGQTFWEALGNDAALSASFDALMGEDVAHEASAIVGAYDWGTLESVVDVGGGNGSLLVSLLRAFPTLRGTVVELSPAADAARRILAASGLAERAEVVTGSFFGPLPRGAGGYVLSAITHNWDNDSVRAILRRCARAAGAGGAVFVIERSDVDAEQSESEAASRRTDRDLRMLAYFGGRERTTREIGALAGDSGLDAVAHHEAPPNTITELRVC
jgi:O-methyltransferase domain